MKKFVSLFIIISLVLFCASCKKNYYHPDIQPSPEVQTKIEITDIELYCSKTFLNIGETMALDVEISPPNASEQPIVLKSSNEEILSVNENGIVFAKKEGTATIIVCSAEDEKVESQCEVTVLPLKKAIITSNIPMSSYADAAYTVTVSFENCIYPSIKIITDCKGGQIKNENGTIGFGSELFQYQTIGNTTINLLISGRKKINSVRVLCFDNGELIDSKEYNVILSKRE